MYSNITAPGNVSNIKKETVVVCNSTRNGTSEDQIVAEHDVLLHLRIRTTQSEIKIFAKRRNIESLGQIFQNDKSGRPNWKSRSSQKDRTSHD